MLGCAETEKRNTRPCFFLTPPFSKGGLEGFKIFINPPWPSFTLYKKEKEGKILAE
jgi:hypothetical protein